MTRRCVLALAAAVAAPAEPAGAADSIFDPIRSDNQPGGAVLALRDGRILFQRGYGLANLKSGDRNTPETNFRLASVTKQFTAMCIMLLVHDGKLRYDERLTDVFPDFPSYGHAIRIRNLLSHTAGLPDYEDIMDQEHWDPSRQINDEEVLAIMKRAAGPKFEPGTRFSYSNSAFVVLGLVVAKVSGKPFDQFLHDRIFAPLGMTNTVAYVKGKNEVPHRAYGYTKEAGEWRETDQSPTSATLGDGGIYSSLNDLAKWYRALDGYRLLSPAEMAPAWTPIGLTADFDGVKTGYGFGWALDTLDGWRRIWHSGDTVGFRANVQRFPQKRLTVVVLENRTEPLPRPLATRLAELYLR
jgi:CubicO group peptidase (beta-lactamase class C family)